MAGCWLDRRMLGTLAGAFVADAGLMLLAAAPLGGPPPLEVVLMHASLLTGLVAFCVRRGVFSLGIAAAGTPSPPDASRDDSDQTIRALFDAVTESVFLIDPTGVVRAVNQTGARRLCSTPDAMVGRNALDFLPPELREPHRAKIEEVCQTGQPITFEDQRHGRQLENTLYPVVAPDNRVVRVAVYVTDITRRWQAQAIEALLHEVDHRALAAQDNVDGLLDFICAELVRVFAYHGAWIGRKQKDGRVRVLACAGDAVGYREELERLGLRWDGNAVDQGAAGLAISTGRIQILKIDDPRFQSWRPAAERWSIQARLGIPLTVRDQTYGAFVLFSERLDAFDDEATITMLAGLGSRISVALEMAVNQQQLRLLGTALASAGNGIFITGRDGVIEWVNAAFTRLSGYTTPELIGQNPRLFNSGQHPAEYYQELWSTIRAGQVWTSKTVERRKDGSPYTVRQTITPIRSGAGEITHYIAIHEDITAQEAIEARVQHMAHYDLLTDLPNRALFFDRLHHAVALARRYGHRLALLFIDLDRFKQVNDSFGHHVGDRLLQEVAERLRACVRDSDTLARLAGDEFTIFLPHITGRDFATVVGERVVTALSLPFALEGHDVRIGASIGIALYPEDADQEDDLIQRADIAMYEAKTQGRNTYRFWTPDDTFVLPA